MNTIQQKLCEMMSCPSATLWAKDQKQPLVAWNQCERGDWMMWLLEQLKMPRNIINKISIECAELLFNHIVVTGPPLKCKKRDEFELMAFIAEVIDQVKKNPDVCESVPEFIMRVHEFQTPMLDNSKLSWAKRTAVCCHDVIFKQRKDAWFLVYYLSRTIAQPENSELVPCKNEVKRMDRVIADLIRKEVDFDVVLGAWDNWKK